MNELVLTTIGNVLNEQLNHIFSGHSINIIERKNKQPEIQELLFYCSPEIYLSALSSDSDNKSSVELLRIWMEDTEKQLSYVIANPDGCWLIDLDYVVTNPNQFICFANESLDIDLTECILPSSDILSSTKQCVLLVENDAVQQVYEDIVAAADYYNPAQCITVIDRIGQYFNYLEEENERINKMQIEAGELKIINGKFQLALNDITNENALTVLQVTQLQEELDCVKSNNELSLLQVAQLQEELEASISNNTLLQGENKKLISEENRLKDECGKFNLVNVKQQTELEKIKSENELALLQIAQLQEELDTMFSDNAVLQEENKKLAIESTKEVEKLDQLNKKQQTELTTITSNNAVLQSENELALLQVAQLQEELKVILSNNAVLQGENKKLTSEENKLKNECDKFNLVNVKQQAELEDIKSENELALFQIAQLQEELEFYFMKSQTANTVELRTTFPHLTVSTLKESLQLSKLLSLD